MSEEKNTIEIDDYKQEGLDIPFVKEIEVPRPQRIIELKIVDTMGMPDR